MIPKYNQRCPKHDSFADVDGWLNPNEYVIINNIQIKYKYSN
jgi:hypothetical protein